MTERGHPKDFDDHVEPANTLALIVALFAMFWMTLVGIGLAWQGLWIIGAPMAVVFAIWFLRTLVRRPPWRWGGDTRTGGRSRFWKT